MFEGLFQPIHVLLILAVALVVLGPGKLPELGSGLGKAIREFRKAFSDEAEASRTEKEAEGKGRDGPAAGAGGKG